MKNKIDKLVDAMSQTLTSGDVTASKQLAKISAIIISKRIEKEMNQKEFAEFAGVSQSMVSKWESGEYNFTVETLAKICEKLNLDLEINMSPQWSDCANGISGYAGQTAWKGAVLLGNSVNNSVFEVA